MVTWQVSPFAQLLAEARGQGREQALLERELRLAKRKEMERRESEQKKHSLILEIDNLKSGWLGESRGGPRKPN